MALNIIGFPEAETAEGAAAAGAAAGGGTEIFVQLANDSLTVQATIASKFGFLGLAGGAIAGNYLTCH